MPIRECKRTAIIMPGGWKTNPGPLRGSEQPPLLGSIDAKSALLNAFLMFVDEDERLTGRGFANVCCLMPALPVIGVRWFSADIHIHAHGHATGPPNQALIAYGGLIGGAFVNANGFVVPKEGASLDIGKRGVGPGISLQPGVCANAQSGPVIGHVDSFVGWQHILIIVTVHLPAKLKLTVIIETADLLRFGFCLAQSRKKHRR